MSSGQQAFTGLCMEHGTAAVRYQDLQLLLAFGFGHTVYVVQHLSGKGMWQLPYCKSAQYEACWVGHVMFPVPSVVFVSVQEKMRMAMCSPEFPNSMFAVMLFDNAQDVLFPEKVGNWDG